MMLDAGVRFLELACGPCCAIGQSPATNGVAVRTTNRNFKGRSGNPNAEVYLVSPESAAATAITGIFASAYDILGDDVSTDDITPASAEFSSMRSNIPLMSKYCFHRYDPEFSERAKNLGKSIIIGGENYGQGSSREHAAINPMFLGVKCVIAKSIARIHKGNLVNHGIVPMLFENPSDYDRLEQGDTLEIVNFPEQIKARRVKVRDADKDFEFTVRLDMSDSEIEASLDGGQLRHLKRQLQEMGITDKN